MRLILFAMLGAMALLLLASAAPVFAASPRGTGEAPAAIANGDIVQAPTATTLELDAPIPIVAWGGRATLIGELQAGGASVDGQTLRLEYGWDGVNWTFDHDVDPNTAPYASSQYIVTVLPTRATYYRLRFAGTDDYAAIDSNVVKITPRAKLGRPVAPQTVKKRRLFLVYGALAPRHTPGKMNVWIKCYLKSSGRWVLKKTVATKNTIVGSKTRYKVRMSLPSAGAWKLEALYKATAKYAKTSSNPRYLRAR